MLRSAGASLGKKANIKCFECQQQGHYAAECPSLLTVATTVTTEQRSSQVNTVSPGPLVFIQIQMQGVTTEALIDTGSSVNIMDTALYERVGGVIQLCEGALTQPKMRLRDFSRNTLSAQAQLGDRKGGDC